MTETIDTATGIAGDVAAVREARRHTRYDIDMPVTCRFASGEEVAARLIDASEGGFGLSAVLPIDVGTEFDLVLGDAGTFPCRLIWTRGGRCGVQLQQPGGALSDADLSNLAASLA